MSLYNGCVNGNSVTNTPKSFEELQDYSSSTWQELEFVKCDEYEVGNYVLVQNKRGFAWNIDGKMDSYICKICVISEKINENIYKLNHDKWYFNADDFVGKLVPKTVLNK